MNANKSLDFLNNSSSRAYTPISGPKTPVLSAGPALENIFQ